MSYILYKSQTYVKEESIVFNSGISQIGLIMFVDVGAEPTPLLSIHSESRGQFTTCRQINYGI